MLKGREKEFKAIEDYISTALSDSHPTSIMIHGVPGSGKTATVKLVLKALQKRKFKFSDAYINCASIHTKTEFHNQIYRNISGKDVKLTNFTAQPKTEELIFKQNCILVLDEVDFLSKLDKKNVPSADSIMKKVFAWPLRSGGKVVVIGISNELDISEKLLSKRGVSAPEVVVFKAYTADDLSKILTDYVEKENYNVLPVSIKLISKKIAASSGDVRKAISLLSSNDVDEQEIEVKEAVLKRPSLEQSTPTKRPRRNHDESSPLKRPPTANSPPTTPRTPRTPAHVLASLNNINSSAVKHVDTLIPLHPKIVFASILRLVELDTKNKKSQTTTFPKILELYDKLCTKQNIPGLNHEDVRAALVSLETNGYITMKKNKVIVKVHADEAVKAISDNVLVDAARDIFVKV